MTAGWGKGQVLPASGGHGLRNRQGTLCSLGVQPRRFLGAVPTRWVLLEEWRMPGKDSALLDILGQPSLGGPFRHLDDTGSQIGSNELPSQVSSSFLHRVQPFHASRAA